MKLAIYYCHQGACQTIQNTCSFLHAHYTETYKVVEKFVKTSLW